MGGAFEPPAFVLHCDVDAFFVQVEQLKDPSLQASAGAMQRSVLMCKSGTSFCCGFRRLAIEQPTSEWYHESAC